MRRLAGDALTPSLSAVVTTVPKPGLAEAMEEEKEQYLKEKKASSGCLQNGRMRSDRFVEHLYIKADLKFRL